MAAVPALSATLANAQNIPKKVTILTPLMGSTVGMKGMGWMMDVVAEFSASSAATSSAVATPSSGSSGGGGGYRRSNPTTDPDDGFFPFLNSPTSLLLVLVRIRRPRVSCVYSTPLPTQARTLPVRSS